MLEVVDERILERRVEERREVGRPHHRRRTSARPRPGAPGSARRASAARGRSQRRRVPARTDAEHQRDRRRQREERRGDQHQQDVLDHVDREQGRVVALDARRAARTRAPASRPGTRRSAGAGRGSRGWAASTRRTAHSHQPTRRRDRRASGSAPRSSRGGAMPRSVARSGRGRGPATGTAAASAATASAPTAATERSDQASSGHRRAWSHEPAGAVAGRSPPIPSRARETHALRVEWPRFDPGRSDAPAESSVVAPRAWRAAISRTLMSSSPRSRHLPDRDLRPRCRRRHHRPEPDPRRPRRERRRGGRGSSSAGSSRRSRSRPRAPQIRDLYTIVFLIAVAIFIVVEGLIIWSVIRYRRKPGDDTLPPQTHGNNIAEFVWTIVPTILVIFMFVISWQTLNQVDKSSADAQTKIRAVAGQFQWTVRLPRPGRHHHPLHGVHPAGQRRAAG